MSFDPDVESLMAEAEGIWQESSGDWKPTDGMYTVVLKDVTTGIRTVKETGKKSVWIKAVSQIVDGKYENRIFTSLFAQTAGKNPDAVRIGLTRLDDLVKVLSGQGEKLPLAEAVNLLTSKVGTVYTIDVKTSSKPGGPSYTNYYPKEVLG